MSIYWTICIYAFCWPFSKSSFFFIFSFVIKILICLKWNCLNNKPYAHLRYCNEKLYFLISNLILACSFQLLQQQSWLSYLFLAGTLIKFSQTSDSSSIFSLPSVIKLILFEYLNVLFPAISKGISVSPAVEYQSWR